MGIRFYCPNGCKIHVKAFQAGKRGICPHCGCPVDIPLQSTRGSSKQGRPTASHENMPRSPEALAAGSRGGADKTSVPPGLPPTSLLDAIPPLPTMPAPTLEPPPTAAVPFLSAPSSFTETVPTAPVVPSPQTASQVPIGADPLDEAPDAVWYVCPPTGGQFGPASSEVMRSWLAEGRVSADSLVWRGGWQDWKLAAEVFPETYFPPSLSLDALGQVSPTLGHDQPVTLKGARNTTTLGQLLILAVLIALGGGFLAAVYVWVRFF